MLDQSQKVTTIDRNLLISSINGERQDQDSKELLKIELSFGLATTLPKSFISYNNDQTIAKDNPSTDSWESDTKNKNNNGKYNHKKQILRKRQQESQIIGDHHSPEESKRTHNGKQNSQISKDMTFNVEKKSTSAIKRSLSEIRSFHDCSTLHAAEEGEDLVGSLCTSWWFEDDWVLRKENGYGMKTKGKGR